MQILEVQDVAHSPYQNRHGGASRDMLLKLRSVQAINRRGRWATDVSARIYSKPGKFQQDHQSVQPSLGAVRRRCEAELRGLSPEWKRPFTSSSPKASGQLHGSLNGKAFLSLFGGVGKPAKFWCECGGGECCD